MDATPPREPRSPSAPDTAGAPAPPPGAPGPDGGAPLPLGAGRAATGYAPVDALLERLGEADHLAADGHLRVYEDVHEGLRDALAALDAHPRPGSPNEHRS
ncbi:hypothetical protein LUW75_20045 [Streptomyces sp. MRC013]|uniref:hypothetical protein n=1 Tax=Streptomyces sp. MRC013 TaxID=2898276 RepID=UPI002025F0E4|nr:hypothetical protein [Streptomyces sp. MRC013]URM91880.1 hypothetical protein LUW75_20045 [Streptomyces sp. MRC013]